ncbi:hypothetical protein ACHAW5_008161 [Stephanodiscus triporus]|uniref:Uncharacterized protein n=1 Tax=Stephanodiscus triporus TaxID=2934178 RepID=A0ABD3Q0I4_9STRA
MLSMTSTFQMEGSIQGQQMPKEVSAEDHLVLRRRQEAYKKFSADVAQISDGRSLEMFRHSCPSLVVVGETKTMSRTKTGRGGAPAVDRESKSRRRSVVFPSISSDYIIRDRLQSESSVGPAGDHGTACATASEVQLSGIGRRISVESDVTMESLTDRNQNEEWKLILGVRNSNHDNVITTNKDTRHDPKNPPLPLAATCPTLYSKLAQGIAKSCTNLSATVAPEPNLIVRPKHHPLHRCPSTNGLVVGIVKPSRYSEGGWLNASSSTIDLKQLSGYPTQLKESDVASKSIKRTTSLLSVHSIITQSNSSTHTKPASNERWVALGVDFHPRTEVYEFDKNDEFFGECLESEECDESLII